jgi:hypothetical protein
MAYPFNSLIVVFNPRTTNGTITTDINGNPLLLGYSDCKCVVKVTGTFDGASVVINTYSYDGIDVIPVTNVSGTGVVFTANKQVTLTEFVNNEPFQVVVTNAGAGTSLKMSLQPTAGDL